MKKLIISLVALFAISNVFAQQFGAGVKAGINLANITGARSSADAKIGFVGGVFGEVRFSESIGISADLLYSGEGASVKDEKETAVFNSQYLNMPILFNYYIGNFAVKAGFQPKLLLSAKLKVDGEISDIKGVYKNFDFSVPVGVSYQFGNHIVADLRYNIGISNIAKNDKGYNSAFALTVGWKF
ncbi:hypothetical protein BN938_0007 [Mucinivorans hirudinis]|uniref:Outer membrane protein beta-barrel domain-containing protein n=1 Tax=Mucinivorans hirudinis TaxID=1433126 RepID=A0A060R9K9_9BACT|nr:hypothetical protein BN938_0007 [Mucinivorans hirudinis]